MPEPSEPPAEEIIRYHKDARTSMGASVRPDGGDELMLDDAMKRGLGDAVKHNDDKFPAEWRLRKKARKKARADNDTKAKRKKE